MQKNRFTCMTSRDFDMNLGSQTSPAPTARDLMELMRLLVYAHVTDQEKTI